MRRSRPGRRLKQLANSGRVEPVTGFLHPSSLTSPSTRTVHKSSPTVFAVQLTGSSGGFYFGVGQRFLQKMKTDDLMPRRT
jgi:hypothetical protein